MKDAICGQNTENIVYREYSLQNMNDIKCGGNE